MPADLLAKVPPALKSLWQLENELRSALHNSIFLRKEEAGKHLEEARRHLEDALASLTLKPAGAAEPVTDPTEPPPERDFKNDPDG